MDYNLTKKDVAKLLNRSGKTIGRYIKAGKLHPIKKKVDGYYTYLFTLDDVEDFKRTEGGQIGHEGQDTIGHRTNEGTNDTPPTPDNAEGVNNLHGGTQGTNHRTKEDKKDTPQDIKDTTQDKRTLTLLEKTLDMLQTTLDNQSKQIDNLSRQIDNLSNTQQFLINENSGYRKMLGLPTAREDIVNGTQEGEVVDIKEGTKDRTQDKTQRTQRTKESGQPSKKVANKTKQNKGQGGQKDKNKPKQTPKPDTKKDNKKRGIFSWIFR